MHRLTCTNADEALDDNTCLLQIPKRKNRKPTPGERPDFDTGWGLEIIEGCSTRAMYCMVVGFMLGGIFGIFWSIWERDISSGFAVASWIMGSEAVAVAIVQIIVFLHAR
jgi:hypothetical protein